MVAQKQMRWPNTGRIVTSMQDMESRENRSIRQFPGHAWREDHPTVGPRDMEGTITRPIDRCGPGPATRALLHFGPECHSHWGSWHRRGGPLGALDHELVFWQPRMMTCEKAARLAPNMTVLGIVLGRNLRSLPAAALAIAVLDRCLIFRHAGSRMRGLCASQWAWRHSPEQKRCQARPRRTRRPQ